MVDAIAIRWHGRGGQGTVTACKVFAEACLSDGHYVQAFPEYGPERAGAPIKAYNRVNTKPLRGHYPVLRPDIVVVVDSTLLDCIDVTEGAPDGAAFIVNCNPKNCGDLRAKIKAKPTQRVVAVDASHISIATLGRPMPNAPLIGTVTKVSDMLSLQAVLDDIKVNFSKKFSQKVTQGNLEATRRGYEEGVEL
ncbi:2-oxoacid:acceptor oxidoreductase family protein [Holophaga foetida]|uniref:2-oxoacid:acceptor oxidoreductase family protein n=1 Tax=Holophaga foetida TaxID=35839 RepID=UPI0002472664|nr:2-oxoacid:acceptor oxidoreductase family protein [Holophaga foetida]